MLKCEHQSTVGRNLPKLYLDFFKIPVGPPGMPGKVYRIKGSETTRSVTIKWTVPPNHGPQVQEYNIEALTSANPTWRPLAMSRLPSLQDSGYSKLTCYRYLRNSLYRF